MSKAVIKCSLERIRTLRHSPGSDVAVDDVAVVNGLVTIAFADIASGDNGQYIYQADEVNVVKASGVAVTEGDPAYYDAGNDNFTPTAAGNTLCGRFLYDQASGDTEAYIELNQALSSELPAVLDASNLPTSDPAVAGQVWSNAGILTVSSG